MLQPSINEQEYLFFSLKTYNIHLNCKLRTNVILFFYSFISFNIYKELLFHPSDQIIIVDIVNDERESVWTSKNYEKN